MRFLARIPLGDVMTKATGLLEMSGGEKLLDTVFFQPVFLNVVSTQERGPVERHSWECDWS